MDEFIKLLDPGLNYLCHEMIDDTIIITVESNKVELKCPFCGYPSSKKHSVYERSFQDLPIMGKKTKIVIHNKKMLCLNPDCNHTTFAETFGFIKPKAKKSNRLLDKIVDFSLNISSINASDILKNGIADVGKSTICNLLKKRYTPTK